MRRFGFFSGAVVDYVDLPYVYVGRHRPETVLAIGPALITVDHLHSRVKHDELSRAVSA